MNKKDYLLIASILLFVTSLPLPCLTAFRNSINHIVRYPFIYILIFGSVSFLFDFLEWLVWVANPLYFLSIYLFKKGHSSGIYVSAISTLLTFSLLTFSSLTITGSGRTDKIISFNIGYWFWTASLITLTIAIVVRRIRD